MTLEEDWADKSEKTNRRFVDKAVTIAREVEAALGPTWMTYRRDPVRWLRDALADRVFAILAAARDASTLYSVANAPVAILSGAYGDDYVNPTADAIGVLAGTMARAATVLTGADSGHLHDESTGPWLTGLLDDVRNAAREVIRRADGSA